MKGNIPNKKTWFKKPDYHISARFGQDKGDIKKSIITKSQVVITVCVEYSRFLLARD